MDEQAAQQPVQPQPTETDMQQVATFVAQARAQGVPDAAVRSQLLEAGWDAAVVDGYLNTMPLAQQAAARQPKKPMPAVYWVVSVLAILLFFGGTLVGAVKRVEGKKERTHCLSNLKEITLAMRMYTEDYDQRTPLPTNIPATLDPYVRYVPYIKHSGVPYRNIDVWYCPSCKSSRPGYATVKKTTNSRPGMFNPAKQFTVFESNLGAEPLVGGAQDIALPARHLGGYNFGFMDGHAKWYLANEIDPNGWGD